MAYAYFQLTAVQRYSCLNTTAKLKLLKCLH